MRVSTCFQSPAVGGCFNVFRVSDSEFREGLTKIQNLFKSNSVLQNCVQNLPTILPIFHMPRKKLKQGTVTRCNKDIFHIRQLVSNSVFLLDRALAD